MTRYLSDGTPVLDIGAGDLNSDWIKYVDHGRHQLRDLMAHEEIMIAYYEREGLVEKAEPHRVEWQRLHVKLQAVTARYGPDEALAERVQAQGEMPSGPGNNGVIPARRSGLAADYWLSRKR